MEEICRECNFDQSTAPPRQVAEALAPLAHTVSDGIRAVAHDKLRHRPTSAVWSPLEYLGHLRESMAFHRWLIERAAAENNPAIPAVDPDQSVALAKYNEADPEELIKQLDRRVLRLAGVLSSLSAADAQRLLTLDGRPLSTALIARSAWHECHHHLGDIRRLGRLK